MDSQARKKESPVLLADFKDSGEVVDVFRDDDAGENAGRSCAGNHLVQVRVELAIAQVTVDVDHAVFMSVSMFVYSFSLILISRSKVLLITMLLPMNVLQRCMLQPSVVD